MKTNGARVTIDKGSLAYTCNNPAIDPVVDDVTVRPNPTHSKPTKPDVSIFCKPGFKLVDKKCIRKPVIVVACKKTEVLLRGTCVKKPDVSILCAPGFKLTGKKCIRKPVIVDACKRMEVRINGKCVKKPTVSILCKPGFKLIGKECVRKPVIQGKKILLPVKRALKPVEPVRPLRLKRVVR